MKYVSILFFMVAVGCASGKTQETVRNKFSDKSLRVFVVPNNLPPDEYVALNNAVIGSESFSVVDRSAGFKAIQQEQIMIHRDEVDRFDDKEKFAQYGRLYSVGAVIVGHIQCKNSKYRWSGGAVQSCMQSVMMIDTNSSEIIASAQTKEPIELDYSATSNWDDLVAQLLERYPKTFKPQPIDPKLVQYKEESKERAIRQKEDSARSISSQPDHIQLEDGTIHPTVNGKPMTIPNDEPGF